MYNFSWRTSQDSCFQVRQHSTNHLGRVIVKTTKSWFFWGELRVEALTTGNITVFVSWIRGYFMIFNGYFYDMSWYFLIFQGLQYMTSKPVFRASRTSSGSSKWLPMVNADSPSSWFNQNRVTMMTALFFSMQEMHTRPPKMTTMWFQFYHVSWRNCQMCGISRYVHVDDTLYPSRIRNYSIFRRVFLFVCPWGSCSIIW